MSKYIFLDIDGVLNSMPDHFNVQRPEYKNDFYLINEAAFIEKKKLQMLHDLVYKTRAHVVGISSWFTSYDKREVERVIKLPVLDVVENSLSSDSRGFAILEWLELHGYDNERDYFVVLDDIQKRSFRYPKVYIQESVGLTKKGYEEAVMYLYKKQDIQVYKKLYISDEEAE